MKLMRIYDDVVGSDIFNPEYYLTDYFSVDWHDHGDEQRALKEIQNVIDFVRNLQYPLKVYRGINPEKSMEDYDNNSWSLSKHVAEGFGERILVGMIPDKSIVNIEQTIRTRCMEEGEAEIFVADGRWNDVKIVDTYIKR